MPVIRLASLAALPVAAGTGTAPAAAQTEYVLVPAGKSAGKPAGKSAGKPAASRRPAADSTVAVAAVAVFAAAAALQVLPVY